MSYIEMYDMYAATVSKDKDRHTHRDRRFRLVSRLSPPARHPQRHLLRLPPAMAHRHTMLEGLTDADTSAEDLRPMPPGRPRRPNLRLPTILRRHATARPRPQMVPLPVVSAQSAPDLPAPRLPRHRSRPSHPPRRGRCPIRLHQHAVVVLRASPTEIHRRRPARQDQAQGTR
jgi:hypothetical protein